MNHSLWMNYRVSVVNEHSALGHLVIWAESRHLDIMIYPTWDAEGCSRWSLFPHWLIPNKMNSPFGSTIWGICCRTFEGPLSQIRKKQAVLDVCPKMSGTTLDVSERNWRKEPPIRRSNGPTLKMAGFFWALGTHDGPNPESTWKWGIVGHSKDQSHSKLGKVPWKNSAIWWFPVF
jgi:hypothetical protein